MQTENKYIGDEKMLKMLEHYHCPTPLEIIKMRFAGAACSPNMNLRPADVIASFWPQGQSPRLETKQEADLFFKFFMGLWDEIFTLVRRNRIKLEKLTDKDPAYYFQRRYHEIEDGYVEGFWGGQHDLKLPVYLAQAIDSLSELGGIYRTLAKKLDNGGDIAEIIQALAAADSMVEKAIALIIETSVLPRIDALQRTVN